MKADQDPYYSTIYQLAQYEVWCNARSLDCADALAPSQVFQEFPFGFRTIHRTLYHVLAVLGYWTGSICPQITKRWEWDYEPQITLSQMKQLNDDLSRKFVSAIEESHAANLLSCDRRIVQVFHLVTHGTHHRTQFISMLRMLGVDPPFEAGDFAGWQRVTFENSPAR